VDSFVDVDHQLNVKKRQMTRLSFEVVADTTTRNEESLTTHLGVV